MSKTEASLLLYLETCATDHQGRMDMRHLNDADRMILANWGETGFIQYGRIESEYLFLQGRGKRTHWCRLSGNAYLEAHRQRRLRSERGWKRRQWQTTSELQGEGKIE